MVRSLTQRYNCLLELKSLVSTSIRALNIIKKKSLLSQLADISCNTVDLINPFRLPNRHLNPLQGQYARPEAR